MVPIVPPLRSVPTEMERLEQLELLEQLDHLI
jgi:hypothetical protein